MRSEAQNLAHPRWEGNEAPAPEERTIKEFVDIFLSENHSREVGELDLKSRLERVPQMESSDDPTSAWLTINVGVPTIPLRFGNSLK